MKCENSSCPYHYVYTGKCELNPVDEWDMCPYDNKKKLLKEIGEGWIKRKGQEQGKNG